MLRDTSIPLNQAAFAAAIIAIGACGLVAADFVAAWQPVPHGIPARQLLVYVCAVGCLVAGAGLLWRRSSPKASCALLAAFLFWMVAFRLPVIFRAPTAAVSYESWGECAVMVAATWMIFALGADHHSWRPFAYASGTRGVRIARSIFGLALVAFGVAHFVYVQDTAALVPSWLPAHAGWVYVTGITYVAAGAAMLAGVVPRTVATLAALQMGLFTVLIWIPAVLSRHADVSQWSELLDSWALASGAWVMAGSRAR